MKVRAGVGILGWPFPQKDSAYLWDIVDMCESLEVDSIWISDRIVSPGLSLESMSILAALAGRTKRMKFGNSVLALPLRNPTVLAKQIATIDFISGGRMLPAVGLGTDNPAEYEACGVNIKERAGRTDEAIVLMRKLWTEDSVTFHGKYFSVTNVHLEPRTIMKPCPPIWVGGRTDAALRRAGRLGDGWLASTVTAAEVGLGIEAIRKYAGEAHRSVPDDHYGVIVSFCFDENHEKALERASGFILPTRTDARPEECGAFGNSEDIIERIKRYIDAGATKFVMRATCPPEETLAQTERLAREVIPVLHRITA